MTVHKPITDNHAKLKHIHSLHFTNKTKKLIVITFSEGNFKSLRREMLKPDNNIHILLTDKTKHTKRI